MLWKSRWGILLKSVEHLRPCWPTTAGLDWVKSLEMWLSCYDAWSWCLEVRVWQGSNFNGVEKNLRCTRVSSVLYQWRVCVYWPGQVSSWISSHSVWRLSMMRFEMEVRWCSYWVVWGGIFAARNPQSHDYSISCTVEHYSEDAGIPDDCNTVAMKESGHSTGWSRFHKSRRWAISCCNSKG